MAYITPANSAPSDTSDHIIEIPNNDDWMAIVYGALSDLIHEYNFEQVSGITPAETAARFLTMFFDMRDNLVEYPREAFLWQGAANTQAGGQMLNVFDTLSIFSGRAHQTPGAQNDAFEHSCMLAAGNYKLTVIHIRNTNQGKVDLVIAPNGQFIATLDLYSATLTRNVFTEYSFTLSKGGLKTLTGLVALKNAASSGYLADISCFLIRQA